SESRSVISGANSPFGDPPGDQVVDSFLADTTDMPRGVFVTPLPNRIEFILESHCGHSHRIRQVPYRHWACGSLTVVPKCKFDIFSHDMSETPSGNANPSLMLRFEISNLAADGGKRNVQLAPSRGEAP